MRVWTIGVVLAGVMLISANLVSARRLLPVADQSTALNIVLVMTDDQRWDTVCFGGTGQQGICALPAADRPMPNVESRLMAEGLVFRQAFVSNPLCCPVRASFLAGGLLSQHTNVISNDVPNGSVHEFIDVDTLPTRLQAAGYRTALIGKYLNGYSDLVDFVAEEGYVPPGWNTFTVWAVQESGTVNQVVSGSSGLNQGETGQLVTVSADTYATDYERDQALAFINDTCPEGTCSAPFFLMLATAAPHRPAIPAPRHEGAFTGYRYRERGWAERPGGDLSDKPNYVSVAAATWNPTAEWLFQENQLESLLAVDEAIGALLDELEALALLESTVFVFASDNGMLWGEHKLVDKSLPYEESIRVPLVVRYPGVAPRVVDNIVAFDLDLPPTIAAIAGAVPLPSDGMSLLPLIADPGAPWRTDLLIQNFENMLRSKGVPGWALVRTADNMKYVEFATGERELYVLDLDPFEKASQHLNPAYQSQMQALADRLVELGPGVAVRTKNLADPAGFFLPQATVGVAYNQTLLAGGGDGTYSWTLFGETDLCVQPMPDGLSVLPTGKVAGIPTTPGVYRFCVQVTDGSVSPQPGNDRAQEHVKLFSLMVVEP